MEPIRKLFKTQDLRKVRTAEKTYWAIVKRYLGEHCDIRKSIDAHQSKKGQKKVNKEN